MIVEITHDDIQYSPVICVYQSQLETVFVNKSLPENHCQEIYVLP